MSNIYFEQGIYLQRVWNTVRYCSQILQPFEKDKLGRLETPCTQNTTNTLNTSPWRHSIKSYKVDKYKITGFSFRKDNVTHPSRLHSARKITSWLINLNIFRIIFNKATLRGAQFFVKDLEDIVAVFFNPLVVPKFTPWCIF